MKFTALLHHVTPSLFVESFYELKRNAAAGVDEVTWRDYEGVLYARVHELHREVHTGRYRAQPSRRVYIEKADGKLRPLGIAALEDKIVQQAVVKVLSMIYEEDFLGFSYGFRRGRSQHDALDALTVGIKSQRVVQGYFNYFAVPGNSRRLGGFRYEVCRAWRRLLQRRSQRHRQSWQRFGRWVDRYIPPVRVSHPYPEERFRVKHPRQEPCAVIPLAGICAGGRG